MPASLRTVVLVEGESDRMAVMTLAARLGRDLPADGVEVRPLGGITNAPREIVALTATPSVRLAGLYDAAEEYVVRRGLRRAGLGSALPRDEIAGLGFFVCVEDLEGEMIRALGTDRVVEVIGAAGETRPWETMRHQPAQEGRPIDAQLRRFMGTRGGRKIRYGTLLADALDLGRIPTPLAALLDHV